MRRDAVRVSAIALHYSARRESPERLRAALEALDRMKREATSPKRKHRLARRRERLRHRLELAEEIARYDWAAGEKEFIEWVEGATRDPQARGAYRRWRARAFRCGSCATPASRRLPWRSSSWDALDATIALLREHGYDSSADWLSERRARVAAPASVDDLERARAEVPEAWKLADRLDHLTGGGRPR